MGNLRNCGVRNVEGKMYDRRHGNFPHYAYYPSFRVNFPRFAFRKLPSVFHKPQFRILQPGTDDGTVSKNSFATGQLTG